MGIAVLVFFVMIIAMIIASIPLTLLVRSWVRASAFQGYSRTHIKKAKREANFGQKPTLWYLIKHKNQQKTKRRIIAYWVYLGFIFTLACLLAGCALGWVPPAIVRILYKYTWHFQSRHLSYGVITENQITNLNLRRASLCSEACPSIL